MQLSFNARIGLTPSQNSVVLSRQLSGENYDKFLRKVARDIFNKALQLVPVKTGTLKASGQLFNEVDYHTIIFKTPYAGYVHEVNISDASESSHSGYLRMALTEVTKDLRSMYDENVPDFLVRFEVTPEGYMKLVIMGNQTGIENNKFSWRSWTV
mgnify:CR=1 FL=1